MQAMFNDRQKRQMTAIAETIRIAVRDHQVGRLEEAESLYREVLECEPDHSAALHSLGVIAHQRGRHDAAVDLIVKAIANDPKIPQFRNTLGLVFEACGKLEEAIDAYSQAVRLKPDFAEAYNNMAIALHTQGRYEEAVESCRQALLLRPDYAQAFNTLGYALQEQGKFDKAIENYNQAVQLDPDFAEPYNHLGVLLSSFGRYVEAIDNYEQAIRIDPDYAEAHWNLSLALLISGKLTRGWREYRWRDHVDLEMVTYPHSYDQPRWDGSSFVGKRLLVHYEQGFGDTIQFARYLPMVKQRGGTVIFEIREPLMGLIHRFPGIDELVEASFEKKADAEFDLHVSVMDLPQIFGTTLETIPNDIPYMFAEPSKVKHWQKKLSGADFKVGIVWAGASIHEKDHIRSCRLEDFAPLARIDGVRLHSLQKGEAAAQVEELAPKMPVENLTGQIEGFADTAAVIENLDLVITVDTAVAHLAGAMGKRVWILLCHAPDWRWMLERQDSPWYPSAKLFRQHEEAHWAGVFEHVAEELKVLVGAENSHVRENVEKTTLNAAVEHHQAGRLEEAEKLYRQVLQTDKDHPAALHSLGLIAHQRGKDDIAIDLISKAIVGNPHIARFHNSLGLVLEACGKLEQAIEAYQQAILLNSDYAEAYNNIGIALQSLGRYEAAVDSCSTAVQLAPGFAHAHNALGFCLEMQGKYEEAAKSYAKAIELKDDFAEAYNHLGVVFSSLGRYDEAIENFSQALDIEPNYAEARNNLGIALKALGRLDEAIENYVQAIQPSPDFPEAYYNLANALRDQDNPIDAIEHYQEAIRLKPDYVEAYYNLANVLYGQRQLADAIENYQMAVSLKPDCADAHWNFSLALLSSGTLAEGWKHYQWRHKAVLGTATYPHRYDAPRWDGSSFVGKKLLIHYEQGYGDTIQFVRYLPMAKARGGTVILEARKPLLSLLRSFPGIDELVEASPEKKPAVKFDYYASLMDLPGIFGTTLETIPADVPYILAGPQKVSQWQSKFGGKDFKVGIVWAGQPAKKNDRYRSCPLNCFEQLAAIPGVKLYGLQKGQAAAQASELSSQSDLTNLGEDLSDFGDTAAIIDNLDLIISIDTAVAHLAGAMGKPVWVLVSSRPDWRWMMDREDSPWYPTMRVFRQEKLGGWDHLFRCVTEELKMLVSKGTVANGEPVDDRTKKIGIPVVIAAYKKKHQLEKCIGQLKNQTVPIELFVRDNNEENIYFTAAVNEGIRRYLGGDCRYIIILNQDMYLESEAVEEMVRFMDSHPKCGIGAPLQLSSTDPDYVIWAGGYEAFPLGKHQHGRLSEFTKDDSVFWANGACMILRKEMIEEIGLLDETFVLVGSDSDYCFTARSRGWQVWRIVGARGIHEHGVSRAEADDETEILKLKDNLYFGRKWLTSQLYKELAYEGRHYTPEMIDGIMAQLASDKTEFESVGLCKS